MFSSINVQVQYTEPRRIEYSMCQHIYEYESAYEKKILVGYAAISSSDCEVYFYFYMRILSFFILNLLLSNKNLNLHIYSVTAKYTNQENGTIIKY
jgi:hypothetical protein